jgi:Kef-type K+ transport system membrane component KefB
MSHHGLILFFLQLSIMPSLALFLGQIARKFHQPVVLGELVGGIVLGPTILGTLTPEWFAWLFPQAATLSLAREAVIKIGMLFFLFIAGLEVNIAQLRSQGLNTALTSVLGIVLPFK